MLWITTLTVAGYRALAEFRHQIRRFPHFSEETERGEGLERQHQKVLAIRACDELLGLRLAG
jgi:hypothetical protein